MLCSGESRKKIFFSGIRLFVVKITDKKGNFQVIMKLFLFMKTALFVQIVLNIVKVGK